MLYMYTIGIGRLASRGPTMTMITPAGPLRQEHQGNVYERKDVLTIIVHKTRLNLLPLGTSEINMPHISSLAVHFFESPGLCRVLHKRQTRMKESHTYLLSYPCCLTLWSIALGDSVYSATLLRILCPPLLQPLLVDLVHRDTSAA